MMFCWRNYQSDDTTIIRDPFHGWSITIPAESILKQTLKPQHAKAIREQTSDI